MLKFREFERGSRKKVNPSERASQKQSDNFTHKCSKRATKKETSENEDSYGEFDSDDDISHDSDCECSCSQSEDEKQ